MVLKDMRLDLKIILGMGEDKDRKCKGWVIEG